METTHFTTDNWSQRGEIALDALWGILLGSLALLSCAFLASRVSSTAADLTREVNGRLAAAKGIAVVTASLFSLDRNRHVSAAQITSGSSLRLPNGLRHPLGTISSPSGPHPQSDILTLIDLDNRYRGSITTATVSEASIDATVCGLTSRITRGSFKSYLVFTIEGARQIIGDVVPITSTCARLTGTSISGVVSAEASIPSRPLIFVPIEREYSIFVDRAATLRLASHTGATILENQPISWNITRMTLQEDHHSHGVRIFKLTMWPTGGREISHFIIPPLTERKVWNEVLP